MTFLHALRYPVQSEGGFQRIATLVLVQLIPVIGQAILIGYGFAVVRAVHTKQAGLPPIRWGQALGDGLRFLVMALLYVTPLLIVLPIISAVGTTQPPVSESSPSAGASSYLGMFVSIAFAVGLGPILKWAGKRSKRLQRLIRGVALIVSLFALTSTVMALINGQIRISLDLTQLNTLGVILCIAGSLLALAALFVLHIGGTRFAIERKGLIDVPGNVRLLLKKRASTVKLMMNLLLLGVVSLLTIGLGLALFIVPGLIAAVVCSIGLWYLLGSYSQLHLTASPAIVP